MPLQETPAPAASEPAQVPDATPKDPSSGALATALLNMPRPAQPSDVPPSDLSAPALALALINNTPKPAPASQVGERPAQDFPPMTGTPSVAVSQASDSRRSPLPLILVGAAALCAVGSGVTLGLGVSQYATYNATPELQGSTPTSRAGMLNTANGEIAVAEVLGAAAAALLVATGVSLFF